MSVKGIDHVQLAMPEGREADAVAFYEQLLGLQHVPKPEPLAARGGCWFERGAVKVHLGVEADFRPATNAHPAFLIEDVQALADVIAEAGHRVVAGEPLEGYERVHVDRPLRKQDRADTARPPPFTGPALAGWAGDGALVDR